MTSIRKVPLITGETYHIFNRGIDGRTTYKDDKEFFRFIQAMKYYSYLSPPFKLSRFIDLSPQFKNVLFSEPFGQKLVSIIAYCLMPNHFHILLKQEIDGGTSHFMGQLLNSYTRYFNTKNKRIGQLFLDQFKNVLIENNSQLTHVSRYIHLNPYTSRLVNNFSYLIKYKWSSFAEYLDEVKDPICEKNIILESFSVKSSYKDFVLGRADDQREIKRMQNLNLE